MTLQLIVMLVVPILTILMSGVVASVVTFRLNARLQRRDFMRGRLEELYSALHEFCNRLRGHFLVYLSVLSERIDMNQGNELHLKNLESADSGYFRNVQMLVGIYFPHLQQELDALLLSRDKLSSIISTYHGQYRAGDPDGSALLPSFRAELSNLDRVEETFKKSLMTEARRFI